MVRETWSDASGNYAFNNIDPSHTYLVLGHDHQQVYNAVVQDSITPVGRVNVPRSARQKLRFMAGGAGLSTGYPVLIRVGETAGYVNLQSNAATLPDVVVTTKSFPFYKNGTSDIIFTDTAGNPLDFWLEQVVGNMGDRVAFYWVKLPGDLDAGPVDVYMAYGAGAANPKSSNGSAVFTNLFDDFDSFDSSKWTADSGFATSPAVFSNSVFSMQVGAGANAGVRSKATFTGGYEAIATYTQFGQPPLTAGYETGQFGFVTGAAVGNTLAVLDNVGDVQLSRLAINGEATSVSNGRLAYQYGFNGPTPLTTFPNGRVALSRSANGTVTLTVAGQVGMTRTGALTDAGYLSLHRATNANGSAVSGIDWVFVRKSIASGPPTMLPFAEEIL
jgi:hypothetical protein